MEARTSTPTRARRPAKRVTIAAEDMRVSLPDDVLSAPPGAAEERAQAARARAREAVAEVRRESHGANTFNA